jgi:hypothetical protein
MAQYHDKKYKLFEGDVTHPYEYSRTFSNGLHLGVNDDPNFEDETAMNLEQIDKWIKLNHAEEHDE